MNKGCLKELNQVIHGDCMEVMKEIPDKYFELAIVDPPYGIGRDGQRKSVNKNPKHNRKHFDFKGWDSAIPEATYFNELFRISINQIICGGNYFTNFLEVSRCWITWYKGQNNLTMSDCELLWTSFDKPARQIEINRCALAIEGTIHPTQKPVQLYKWLLKNYAKQGDKILDTHAGSCSSVIACIDYGFQYLAIEKDKDYFNKATERIKKHQLQYKLLA